MEERVDKAGLRRLLDDVELPLSSVLAGMQAAGVALDVAYLDEMARVVRDRMAALRDGDLRAGRGGVQPQLAAAAADDPLRPARLSPGQAHAEGTAVDRRERAREAPRRPPDRRRAARLAGAGQAELDVPRGAPAAGRPARRAGAHDVQPDGRGDGAAVVAPTRTCRTSPSARDLGRQIRRAFVPAVADQVLLVADYSQIELRILAHLSGDEGLRAAFASGTDIHTATAARVFGAAGGPGRSGDAEPREGDQLRARVRDECVGPRLAAGDRVDEAQEFIEAYFASFPQIRDYLDRQVEHATVDGFTETMLGRRRYIPELQASNPRVRDMGRRKALNAPIQGSAADVFKLGMLPGRRRPRRPELDCQMLLTVHDELVFEVDGTHVEEASALVKSEMESAYELDVPLRADIGWGPNWAEAVPAGH